MEEKNWAWISGWDIHDKEEPRIVYFRREFTLQDVPENLPVRVSADSRYKLYVNGRLAELGPCKGDGSVWYYDTVDLASYLIPGTNVLAAVVLRYPVETDKGSLSIFRTDTPGFYFRGEYPGEDGKTYSLSAGEGWSCRRAYSVKIVPENPVLTHLYFSEQAAGDPDLFGWEQSGYDDSAWQKAEPLGWRLLRNFDSSPSHLEPRPIPSMNKFPRRFTGVKKIRRSSLPKEDWEQMLAGKDKVVIPAHTREIIEIDAGELMTGFPRLSVSGGKDAQIRLLYAESYYLPEEDGKWVKGDRTDSEHGNLQGISDIYRVAGIGRSDRPEFYESFWFRTFRFIRLEIDTREEALSVENFFYRETGYPLEIKTWVKTSDETMEAIWDISQRTLRRCMQETYIDCPFYEQLQYVMDSRSQILYTYAVSADDRLARKCFADFRRSQRYDGMIACSYPNTVFSVIPGFSIYYILMLHDHMMYFGDKELIHFYMPAVDAVLEYFGQRLDSTGLVGRLGGILFREEMWSFIDWTAEWDATSGMPPAGLRGPLTMESLLYVLGLERAAEMADFVGREDTAGEYCRRAEQVRRAVRQCCKGSNGMIQDGPGVEEYSQHCQVFALLTDVVSVEQGKENLLKTMKYRTRYTQCSVAMSYYLFRALEKSGLYDYTDRCWDVWRDMIRDHLTTCVEEPVNQRSDCHAWGALALYELPSVVLGVRPVEPGFAEFEVKPVPGRFTWAEGQVVTPKGTVQVNWEKNGNSLDVSWRYAEQRADVAE